MACVTDKQHSREQRKRQSAERTKRKKKDYMKTRVFLGDAWRDWECQRAVCGYKTHVAFARHLLAVHESRCPIYRGYKKTVRKRDSSMEIPVQSVFVPETPIGRKEREMDQQLPGLMPLLSAEETDSEGEGPSSEAPLHSTPIHGKPVARPLFESDDSDSENDSENDKDEEILHGISESDLDATNIAFDDPDWTFPLHDEKITVSKSMTVKLTKQQCIEGNKCIAYNECLQKLVQSAVGLNCPTCEKSLTYRHVKRGTCLVVHWECSSNPKHKVGNWASQPRLEGMYAGNLLLPTCLLLSGNNYTKVALMAKFFKLGFFAETNFYRIQDKYVSPAVRSFWKQMKDDILESNIEPLILAGDGRNDSPGHTAQYCTYSLMDAETKSIVSLKIIDCRETNLNSFIMEKKGFDDAMAEVLLKRPVSELVTDAHVQIKSAMKKQEKYKGIIHQFDVWHVCKSLIKKLAVAGKERGGKDLLPWIPELKKHLWYCSSLCAGDTMMLKDMWTKCLHHVFNVHTWIDTSGNTAGHCQHQIPLPESQHAIPWLHADSAIGKRLRELVSTIQLKNCKKWCKAILPI